MRLDPLSIPFRAGESVVRLAWILVFILIGSPAFGGASGFGLLVVLWFVVALGYQLVYYQRFEYELTDDTLDIASGVVSRRNREIPSAGYRTSTSAETSFSGRSGSHRSTSKPRAARRRRRRFGT